VYFFFGNSCFKIPKFPKYFSGGPRYKFCLPIFMTYGPFLCCLTLARPLCFQNVFQAHSATERYIQQALTQILLTNTRATGRELCSLSLRLSLWTTLPTTRLAAVKLEGGKIRTRKYLNRSTRSHPLDFLHSCRGDWPGKVSYSLPMPLWATFIRDILVADAP